tara:strand:- start:72 stop:473 length:402 start_codon:yes stop_codon:yes gene_type:complete
MATNSTWTVVLEDKAVIKNNGAESGTGYKIDDEAFWSQSKFSNVWAIQYENTVASDQVEFRDETPHCSYADANLGDFQEFITKWDAAHLARLQADWDAVELLVTHDLNGNLVSTETEEEKIARIGPRPTSYSS